MTDEELKAVIADLRPTTDWVKVGAFAITALSTGWAVATYIGDTAKRPEVKAISDEQTRIRIEQVTMGAKVERVEQSQDRVEKRSERLEQKVDELLRGKRQR